MKPDAQGIQFRGIKNQDESMRRLAQKGAEFLLQI
jgi:hypothetical protein